MNEEITIEEAIANPFGNSRIDELAEISSKGRSEGLFNNESMVADDEPEDKINASNPYPFINEEGDIKLGLAIIIEEASEDSIFGDEEKKLGTLVIDTETGKSIMKELPFEIDSLNKANKGVPIEVFTSLADVRKTITLSKSFKNLLNTRYENVSQINTSKEEMTILTRTIKKTSETSKNMKSKISENTSDDLEGTLMSYNFKKHLLITGDAGEGKTFIVDKFIYDNKFEYVQENGHTGLEAIDLVGHMIKMEDGTFAWKDGSLSQAFRMATTGIPVVYFIDEMLRIPARELNILVGSLTPNSRGELKLRTNRPMAVMDGIAVGEEITIPQENFWVVATTNQGAGYQSARIDEALKDRFRMFYQKMPEATVHSIIEKKYKKHKASSLAVKSIVSLIEKTNEIQATGNIPRAFTIRHLSEAIDTAKNLRDVKRKMIELVPNIVSIDSDGKFNKEQMEIVRSLIKKVI